jgi:hypothetical protein
MPSLISWSTQVVAEYNTTVATDSGHILAALLKGWVPDRVPLSYDGSSGEIVWTYELRIGDRASGAYVAVAGAKGVEPVDPIPFALAVIKSVLIGVNQRHDLLTEKLTDQSAVLEEELKATKRDLAESVMAADALSRKLSDLSERVDKLES